MAASVTVIDAATLQLRQTVAVADVLAQTPGVNVVRNGGPGQTTTVHIRGAETEQTVVVVDGIRVNDPASPGGGYDFSNLLVGDIGRIEVLRGPASTLWGADAIGGVISITTARPTAALSGSATAEAGSLDTRSVHASAAGAMDRLTWRIGGGYYQTSGVSAFDSRLGGHERDGSLNASGAGQLGVRLTDWASLDLRYAHVATKTAFDGYPPPLYAYADTGEYGLTRQTAASASLKLTGLDGALVNRFTVQDGGPAGPRPGRASGPWPPPPSPSSAWSRSGRRSAPRLRRAMTRTRCPSGPMRCWTAPLSAAAWDSRPA